MRFFRGLLIFLAALLGALVLAAWLVPQHLDWNRYRDDLTRLAAATLDRPVLIQGPISLRLLPQPMLTASDVRIAGEPNQGAMSAGQLTLDVALGPLLAGRLDAREVVLRGVDLKLPWPLPDNALTARGPAWLAGVSARIEDGRVTIGKVAVTHVAATLALSGPRGGFRLSGTGQAFGHLWHVDANLGAAGADNTAPLDLTLSGEGALQGTEASFAGEISSGGMGGRISAKGPDLALLLPAPKVAFSAEGRLTVASGLAVADKLALSIGGAPAQGAVSLRTTPKLRLDVALTASRLDLDAWLPVLLHAHGLSCPVGIDLSAEAAPLAGGLVRQFRAASEVDRDTVEIRELNAVLPGEANLHMSGTITAPPGSAAATDPPAPRSLQVPPPSPKPAPRFHGKVAITAPDLRTTLRWLAGGEHRQNRAAGATGVLDPVSVIPALAGLPAGVLRRLDVSANASFGAGRLALFGIMGQLDGTRISGDVSLGLGLLEGRPAPVRASFKADRLDLDAWLSAGPPRLGALAHLLHALHLDLQFEAGRVDVAGMAVRDVVLNGAAAGGKLTVNHFEARALGVQAIASGSIDAAGRISHARVVLTTQDPTPIGNWLAPVWRARPAFWRAPLLAWVEANGPAGDVAVNARLLLGNTNVAMQGHLAGPDRGSASFSLDNPDAAQLLRQAGLAGLAATFGAGPLAANMRIAVAPGRIGLDELAVSAGELHARGALSIDRSGEQPRVSGEVAADTLPLPLLDPRSSDPLPLQALRGWQAAVRLSANRIVAGPAAVGRAPLLDQATATLDLNQGKLSLQDVHARILGGSLSGSLALAAGLQPPLLALEGTLSGLQVPGALTGLPLDIVGGSAGGKVALSAAGYSPAAMLATISGQLDLVWRDGALSGFGLPALDAALGAATGQHDLHAALNSALGAGRTPFERLELSASANRGIVQLGKAELTAPSGSAALSGSVDLPDGSVDLHATIRPALAGAPAVGLTIAGPAGAARHLPDLADVIRWQSRAH